jgi:hypothetical protein
MPVGSLRRGRCAAEVVTENLARRRRGAGCDVLRVVLRLIVDVRRHAPPQLVVAVRPGRDRARPEGPRAVSWYGPVRYDASRERRRRRPLNPIEGNSATHAV